jgi:hypothetical protein
MLLYSSDSWVRIPFTRFEPYARSRVYILRIRGDHRDYMVGELIVRWQHRDEPKKIAKLFEALIEETSPEHRGVMCVCFGWDVRTRNFYIAVVHPKFDELPDGAAPPEFSIELTGHQITKVLTPFLEGEEL